MKRISPSEKFYATYDKPQIDDIIFHFREHREIPMQYDYMGEGSELWADYSSYLEKQGPESNSLNAAVTLLGTSATYLNQLYSQESNVSIVDLGVGTGIAVKDLLANFIRRRSTIDYVGVDISQPLLDLTYSNFQTWFGEDVHFTNAYLDFTTQNFRQFLADSPEGKTRNLVLLLGGTLNNFRDPHKVLRHINNNLGPNDLFLVVAKLDTSVTRQHFDFSSNSQPEQLPLDNQRMLDILGIEPSLYTAEQGYDADQQCRYIKVKLNFDVEIQFEHTDTPQVLQLKKGERILLWRAWHQTQDTFAKWLQQSGFIIKSSFQSANKTYILAIAQQATSFRDPS